MGNKSTTTIQVNGQPQPQPPSKAPVRQINDVIRAKTPLAATALHAKPVVVSTIPIRTPKPVAAAPTQTIDIRQVAPRATQLVHLQPHQPQSASTLMRGAVKKPAPGLKKVLNAQTRTDALVQSPGQQIAPKSSITAIDSRRQVRAQQVVKSDVVSHFASSKFADSAVKPALMRQSQSTSVSPTAAIQSAINHPTTSPVTHLKPNRSMDVFQRALETATAHEQKPLDARALKKAARSKPVHHRLASVIMASLAFLLIAGIAGYHYKPNITLRFADAKAGFHALLPSYQPGGFGASNFAYSAGSVAVNYTHPGTSRSYSVTQRKSNLTNDQLLSTVIKPQNGSYQTLQQGNLTIYIYGNNNAAWVSDGMLYKVTSNGNLSTSEIVSIASSLQN